jgi:transcriptional regulator with XRE-family HTH domain
MVEEYSETINHAEILGRRLRDLRQRLRLSQAEVAERIGWHQTNLSQLELGKLHWPQELGTLVRLGRLYGLSPNDMAEMGGWVSSAQGKLLHNPYWQLLQSLVNNLPEGDQEFLLRTLVNLSQAHSAMVHERDQGATRERQEPPRLGRAAAM